MRVAPSEVQRRGGPGAGGGSHGPSEDRGRVCPASCSRVGMGEEVGAQEVDQKPLTWHSAHWRPLSPAAPQLHGMGPHSKEKDLGLYSWSGLPWSSQLSRRTLKMLPPHPSVSGIPNLEGTTVLPG